MKINYPKSETLWVCGIDPETKAVSYYITSKQDRSIYYLYSVGDDGSFSKTDKGKDPLSLEKKYLGR